MTVIIKDVPGVDPRDVLETLRDIRPDRPIATGHGGFVVDELTGLEFLQAYLTMTGQIASPSIAPEPEIEKVDSRSQSTSVDPPGRKSANPRRAKTRGVNS